MSELPHKTLSDLSWFRLVEALAERTHTTRGGAAARAIAPLDLDAARARIGEVSEGRALHEAKEPPPFGQISDVRVPVDRAERGGVLESDELLAVGRTIAGCARLRRHYVNRIAMAPALAARAEPIRELSHVSGPVVDAFEEGGRLSDHASPALGALRRKLAGAHDELKRRVQRMIEGPELSDVLQDNFYTQREDRYVVPIRADAHRAVRGIVHGTSGSGATIFIEPEEIVDLNNRMKLAEGEVRDEEIRILTQLTGLVKDEAASIRIGLSVATELDVLDAAAKLSLELEATAPILEARAPLDLRRARHPMMVLSGVDTVPNDLRLEPGQSLVISGPNAGGKTVALKTVGFVCLLARHGLHVPCDEGSTVPFMRTVVSDMGDDQSIERNLSTFSAHVMHLREFLAEADPDTLVLVNEIAVGTDPEQGAALAQAVLEALADRGARVLVTTHYERLKTLAIHDSRFVNGSVGFDLATLTPTFRLHVGLPGSSGAVPVARRLGLDEAICARAELLLGDVGRDVEGLLAAVEAERKRLEEETERARKETVAAEVARRQAEGALREAREKARAVRKGEHDEAIESLRRARIELDGIRTEIRKGKLAEQDLAAARTRIDQAASDVHKHAPESPRASRGREARPEELVAGAQVLVAKLGGDGVVLASPEKGKVAVRIGALRTTVNVSEVRMLDRSEVRPSTTASKPPRSPGTAPGGAAPAAAAAEGVTDEEGYARSVEGTVDLRGERVDDALRKVDNFLDDALMSSREVICVLHGHGTGALRNAVREHLSAHPSVMKLRPGTPAEGGDGVTLVWLG